MATPQFSFASVRTTTAPIPTETYRAPTSNGQPAVDGAITYDQPTSRTYSDSESFTGGESMTKYDDPGLKTIDPWAALNPTKDPYFNPWDRANMAKTPEGRRLLQQMNPNFVAGNPTGIPGVRNMADTPAGRRAHEQNMWKMGYHKMPNPAKLDPNDYRVKFSEEYYRPGFQADQYNPDTVWTKSGIPKAPPIPQY